MGTQVDQNGMAKQMQVFLHHEIVFFILNFSKGFCQRFVNVKGFGKRH